MEQLAKELPIEPAANEATTRLYLNRLLMECLGWPIGSIVAEEHQSGDYLDYVLGVPERRVVVEAKRVGRQFTLPAGVEVEEEVTLATVRDHSEQNRSAIDQVTRYCQVGGIAIAVLANGEQLLAFLASRQDGVQVSKGRAIVFASHEAMLERFDQLWDYLSPAGAASGALVRRLIGRGSIIPPPEKLSAHIVSYPGFRARSEQETDVKILAGLFLQDLTTQEGVSDDFVRDCYCTNGALSQYALVSKEILKTRYKALDGAVGESADISRTQRDGRLSGEILAAALSSRPIVLLGDVGVGKTMFIRHLLQVDAPSLLAKTVTFYVNFLAESALLVDVNRLIVETVTRKLEAALGVEIESSSFIRAVYNKEVNEFKRGLFGELAESDPAEFKRQEIAMLARAVEDRIGFVQRSLNHLRGTRKVDFLLVLDNVDHHAPEFQDRLYGVAQTLATKWPTAVFIALRPTSFYRSLREGSLNAFQPRVFTISPPRVDDVISKRIEFARKELQETGRLGSFPVGLTMTSDSLTEYLDVLLLAFRENDQLKELVDNLSSGNVRLALQFLTDFVGSGYVSTERLVTAVQRNSRYKLPIHEFLRAVMLGEYSHYDPRLSPIVNVFDVTTNDGFEHFALPILLAACQTWGDARRSGFVEEARVFEHLQELGFSVSVATSHLEKAVQALLLERSDDRSKRSLRITRSGSYTYKKLIATFPYLDAVTVDTPIISPEARAVIRDVFSIDDRLERAGHFVDYLDSCWATRSPTTAFDWPMVKGEARSQISEVRQRLDRRRAADAVQS